MKMEDSFLEYRDKTGVESDSDTEIIDNSLVTDDSYSKKKSITKNRTVFVAESEDSGTSDETDNEKKGTNVKAVLRKSNIAKAQITCNSDDDATKASSVMGQSEMSINSVVLSSSDEESKSPELMPKRRPTSQTKLSNISNSSFIGRKVRKRMILLDSDTDNSIIIESNKNRKQICLKDTPLKVDSCKITTTSKFDDSVASEGEESDQETEDIEESGEDNGATNDENEDSDVKNAQSDGENDESDSENDEPDSENNKSDGENDKSDGEKRVAGDKNKESDVGDGESGVDDSEDDGPDEDQMLMSRATRMSIMGVVPKENDSDDSDYIQSDESNLRSRSYNGSVNSLTELPDVGLSMCKAEDKTAVNNNNGDTSHLTCSPYNSPLHDVTNTTPRIEKENDSYDLSIKDENALAINDEKINGKDLRRKVIDRLMLENSKEAIKENVLRVCDDDDDVTIIDSQPEIIALSSDDDEVTEIKSPKPRRSRDAKKKHSPNSPRRNENGDIKQYLVPESAPNQVVYVKRSVRDSELRKLSGLQEDLKNVRSLLETMDTRSLPDGGAKLRERQAWLEREVRRQGDKVATLLVEPDVPSAEDISRDGFDEKKGLSWDDIQKASNAVQPRMFGKQALATHMAERNLILDRLRDLHESLASRPPETQLAGQPALLQARLMPHQLHALAWLRWRETQRPPGGILADDMGLGKTITMISLILDDKERSVDHGDDGDDSDSDGGGRGGSRLARGGTLVVCPATLMQQWAAEVEKHCRPRALSAQLHHGAQRSTQPHRLAAADLVLTTYNILQRESEKKGVLTRVQWRRVILDEAHIVRNHKSATSLAVSGLRARRRWALTGTPVHNKDLDLFALLKFLRCTPFDELAMWKKWIDNKSLGGQERLSTIMRCVLLRRTKPQLQRRGELACLPPRAAHRVHVTLARDEMNVYQKVLVFSKTLFAQFLHQRAEKQADSEGLLPPHKDTAYARMHQRMVALQGAKPVKSHEILVLLLRLRQLCCHCGLIAAMLTDDDVDEGAAAGARGDDGSQDLLAELNRLTLQEEREEKSAVPEEDEEEQEAAGEQEGMSVADAIRSVLSTRNPVFDMSRLSSKIEAVMRCLRENVFVNKGEKAVVVSQWTSVLRLVQRQLEAERVPCVTLSGQVPVPQRAPLVAAINEPGSRVQVMLLSLCAGGVGLNLCGANHLLLVDPHWNPQLEEQAQDRIYRVGQTKPVHIYRFMCVDTVEQTIRNLQESKLELADNVLTGAKNTNASKLSIEDLKVLFNMGK